MAPNPLGQSGNEPTTPTAKTMSVRQPRGLRTTRPRRCFASAWAAGHEADRTDLADAEALYSYKGTCQMQNLIVGKAITGFGAFVWTPHSRS